MPGIDAIRGLVDGGDCLGATISGSGPSMLLWCRDDAAARVAAAAEAALAAAGVAGRGAPLAAQPRRACAPAGPAAPTCASRARWGERRPPSGTTRGGVLDCSRGRLVGIVNANPDSFSDEGAHAGTERAVRPRPAPGRRRAPTWSRWAASRCGSPTHTPVEVEIGRVVPVIERAGARAPDVPVAVDTFKPAVAEAAIAAGAAILNDPTGLREPEMARRGRRRAGWAWC